MLTSQAVPDALCVCGVGRGSLRVWSSGLSGHCGGLSRSLQTGVWGQSHLAGPPPVLAWTVASSSSSLAKPCVFVPTGGGGRLVLLQQGY